MIEDIIMERNELVSTYHRMKVEDIKKRLKQVWKQRGSQRIDISTMRKTQIVSILYRELVQLEIEVGKSEGNK